jgi:hypothetical protein
LASLSSSSSSLSFLPPSLPPLNKQTPSHPYVPQKAFIKCVAEH